MLPYNPCQSGEIPGNSRANDDADTMPPRYNDSGARPSPAVQEDFAHVKRTPAIAGNMRKRDKPGGSAALR